MNNFTGSLRPGLGDSQETLQEWLRRQQMARAGTPMPGPMQQPMAPQQPQRAAMPQQNMRIWQQNQAAQPANAGAQPAPAPVQSGAGGFLPTDFRDRFGDFLTGLAAGRTPNESLALGGQNLAFGKAQRRGEAAEAAKLNRTREAAVRAGIPADIAAAMDVGDLSNLLLQDYQARRQREQAAATGNKTAAFLVQQGIFTPEMAQNATPEMIKAGLDIYQTQRTREPKGPLVTKPGDIGRDPVTGKTLFENPAAPETPEGKTVVSPNGKKSYTFDITTPKGAAAYRGYIGLGWTDRQGSGVTVNNAPPGLPPSKSVFDSVDKQTEAARTAASALPAFAEANSALDDGAITGVFAEPELVMRKIGTAIGLDDKTVANTETISAAMAPVVLNIVTGLGAGQAISNADKEFAEKAAGGKITLDEATMRRLLKIGEKAARAKLKAHREMIDKVYPDTPENAQVRALFNVPMPELPKQDDAPLSNGRYKAGTVVDDIATIPEGYKVMDEETGQWSVKRNGQLVPIDPPKE